LEVSAGEHMAVVRSRHRMTAAAAYSTKHAELRLLMSD
jgi:hypothetical protein